jgi:adenylate cyclase
LINWDRWLIDLRRASIYYSAGGAETFASMTEERVQRRLAAILVADVVGYSRLMGQDESGTLAALRRRRETVLGPTVAQHRGRIFKVTGDSALVEFASAVSAVQCALELQDAMDAANAGLPEDRRIVLRVAVNMGEVMVEGSDVYGDCVNIAVRLEGIAEPGGICISAKVHEEIERKLGLAWDDLGELQLKNIAMPVRAFRVTKDESLMPQRAAWPVSDKPSIAALPLST